MSSTQLSLFKSEDKFFILCKFNPVTFSMGFPCSSVGKESACSAGDPGLIPGLGRYPGEGNGNSLQYPCLENLGERSLVGCSPWGYKELGTTERLTPTYLL